MKCPKCGAAMVVMGPYEAFEGYPHKTEHEVDGPKCLTRQLAAMTERAEKAETAWPIRARVQPCGCVVCYCEGDQCTGCGARNCGKKGECVFGPDGSDRPNVIYVDHPVVAENARLREACEQLLRHVEQDEATHGRPFAAGNVAREALAEKETL